MVNSEHKGQAHESLSEQGDSLQQNEEADERVKDLWGVNPEKE